MPPDASTLTDEELDKIIEAGTPDVIEAETPPTPDAETPTPVEEPAPEAEAAPAEVPPEEPADPVVEETPPVVEEEPKPVSRRESLRIQKLLEKYGTKPTAPPAPTVVPDTLDYEATLEASPEILQQLTDDRKRATETAYSAGLKQAEAMEWRTLLQIDSPVVESNHAQLNPRDKEHFHPAVANAVNSFYLTMSGYDAESNSPANPGIRYGEFVESLYELAEEIAATKVQTAKKNISKQAAQTGLRPDGSSAKKLNLNQAPEDMTDEELDAYLESNGIPT